MKKACNVFSVIALILVIVGALNWLLIGIFNFNLVSWITMGVKWLEMAIYILVGIAGVFMAVWLVANKFCLCCTCNNDRGYHHNAKNY
ncbi:MAG: DUF378 domain-containing protein [Clostridia bacterium]|nr:DUF378 domain-containing protein [Clostridia bacterium]